VGKQYRTESGRPGGGGVALRCAVAAAVAVTALGIGAAGTSAAHGGPGAASVPGLEECPPGWKRVPKPTGDECIQPWLWPGI
jgi:hypothetical protein